MYQKCPVCYGTGINQSEICSTNGLHVCTVCKGKRIINELTGKPPEDNTDCNCINGIQQTTGGCPVHGVKY